MNGALVRPLSSRKSYTLGRNRANILNFLGDAPQEILSVPIFVKKCLGFLTRCVFERSSSFPPNLGTLLLVFFFVFGKKLNSRNVNNWQLFETKQTPSKFFSPAVGRTERKTPKLFSPTKSKATKKSQKCAQLAAI